ncbi:MAG: hypothetical protein ACE10K_14845 [Rhodothermales bacterium]
MPRPGRPSKLTSETTEALCEKLRDGRTYAVACAHAGIVYETFRNWLRKGEQAKQGEYSVFYDTIRKAEMAGRDALEARALKHSDPLEILGRRWPEDWGKKDRSEIGGDIVVRVEWATDKDKKEEQR